MKTLGGQLLDVLLALAAALATVEGGAKAPRQPVTVADFTHEKPLVAGEGFEAWMKERGWVALMGRPVFFHIQDGALNLVSRPGPIFRKRVWLAVRDRERLRYGLENKVLLRLTGETFRVDPGRFPILHFRMAPVRLPGHRADLRNSRRNDAAFYLFVSFDTPRHEYQGLRIPKTAAYVWANRPWEKPTGQDPDYAAFLRYIPIGHGDRDLGKAREIRRDVREGFRLAFPEDKGKPVPAVVQIGLMIDSNTVDSVAASRLYWIRFEAE